MICSRCNKTEAYRYVHTTESKSACCVACEDVLQKTKTYLGSTTLMGVVIKPVINSLDDLHCEAQSLVEETIEEMKKISRCPHDIASNTGYCRFKTETAYSMSKCAINTLEIKALLHKIGDLLGAGSLT